ncbi:predicted protein [Histoplasma mississippiense (nom. inval.)]|uniref:predicted protein n=1 Tax=Ajellomyces capsulatus (strain NAm1 / WU24) TaxID=2059318 RepID=UPI000157C578|nr:predicted protein [Histoplasma mississippiense (nom. inval.)]EDN08547.1 predicted protein [Histoplasma mississippiense (nom. inval.)]
MDGEELWDISQVLEETGKGKLNKQDVFVLVIVNEWRMEAVDIDFSILSLVRSGNPCSILICG